MDKDSHNLLLAIGRCHQLMKHLANGIKTRPGVKAVTHWFDLINVDDGLRVEEYVDAELVEGHALSWCLELTLTLDCVAVEADVRRIHGDGQDVIAEIADCKYTNVADSAAELLEITQRLCANIDV